MCGIFGHTNFEEGLLEGSHQALNTLSHRGPNSYGYKAVDGIYLGHRRLSILDLSEAGAQPMEHSGVYLTINGEIYNFKELRQDLEQDFNINFTSSSDSEVFLHAYINWGLEKTLDKMDGMFAFAIYDSNTRKIYLGRDHAGIKPLYFGWDGNQLSWASELKALEAFYGHDQLVIDTTAVYDFLTYLYIPCPKTLYKNVYKLEPGHYATFNLNTAELRRQSYWHLQVKPNKHRSYKQTCEQTKNIIKNAIRQQLVSDVPVGFFLSGGVDSSITSYEGAQLLKNDMFSCSIGFDDKSVDESRFAKAVAEKIGSNHITRVVSHEDVNSNPELMHNLFDEPFGDTSAFPTYEVCKLASENVTVVLTGDGGDELFGGYSSYNSKIASLTSLTAVLAPLRPVIVKLKNRYPNLPIGKLARKLEVLAITNPLEKRTRLNGGLILTDLQKQKWRKYLNIPENYDDYWHTRKFFRKDLPLKTRAQYLDFNTYMHEQVLTKVDRASMRTSIETRVPFLSKSVIEHAFTITEKQRFYKGELKGILKDIYKNLLPKEVLFRPKQGFSLGKAKQGDVLEINGKTYAETLLEKFYGIKLGQ